MVADKFIYDAFMRQDAPDHLMEFFHGYTYSSHPVACAAALATLDRREDEGSHKSVASKTHVLEEGIHELHGNPHVTGIRNYGFAAASTLAAKDNNPTLRPYEVAMRMWGKGHYVRYGGDTTQLGLPFVIESNKKD